MSTKVSIITASFNYQDYITETIESVLRQTDPNWEMIIVDDGSVDNSVKIIKSYCEKDSRIKLFQHENNANKGLSETVQLGLKKSSADWVIFLESDDSIEPTYIEEKLKVIKKHPDAKLIFNDINTFGDKKIVKWFNNKYFINQKNQLNKITFPANMDSLLKKFNAIPTFSCVMARKDLFDSIDWNSPIKKSLDYYLWSQITHGNNFYYLNKKLTNWRMSSNSYINRDASSVPEAFLFAIFVRQNINCGKLNIDDFSEFSCSLDKIYKKYKKYKTLFKISICIIAFLVICAFLF